MQTAIVTEFFVEGRGMDYAAGLSQMSLISTARMVLTILATLYVSLADRFGRKRILTISVIGMAAGTLICFLSPSLTVHLAGRAILTFFIATDVHGIYVMGIAPDDRRSTGIIAEFGAKPEIILEAVFGRFSPSGKLPFELPRSMEAVRRQKSDVPFDSGDPLFPYGFGLTY